jgi:hypothetical protein
MLRIRACRGRIVELRVVNAAVSHPQKLASEAERFGEVGWKRGIRACTDDGESLPSELPTFILVQREKGHSDGPKKSWHVHSSCTNREV